MSYAKAARDIADLLESGVVLNEFLFVMLAERLARLKEDKPTISGDRFYRFVRRNSE
jgi:hypothetical protein